MAAVVNLGCRTGYARMTDLFFCCIIISDPNLKLRILIVEISWSVPEGVMALAEANKGPPVSLVIQDVVSMHACTWMICVSTAL